MESCFSEIQPKQRGYDSISCTMLTTKKVGKNPNISLQAIPALYTEVKSGYQAFLLINSLGFVLKLVHFCQSLFEELAKTHNCLCRWFSHLV
jgi:hypothetical protein